VVETVHIRNLGFPVWFTFDTFIQRYVLRCLACACLKGIKKSWVLSLFVFLLGIHEHFYGPTKSFKGSNSLQLVARKCCFAN